MSIWAADIETTGLLEQMMQQESPKLHNFGAISIDSDETLLFEGTDREMLQQWFDEGHTFIMHNGILFDGEALKLLGYDIRKIKIIDTLALSWYLEPTRMKHGLAEYGEEFGVPKPIIEDWENQTQEEYNHRVMEDCKIQKRLWQRQVDRLNTLYGKDEGSHDRIVNFLMWKMEQQRQQQVNRWKLDVQGSMSLRDQLEEEIDEKTEALRQAMPKVPIKSIKKRPAKPFKKSGELSSAGEKWKELTTSMGIPFEHTDDIEVVTGYDEGNPASHVQLKSWLDSLGWAPETFKFVRDADGSTRNIPQINLKGGDICQSVKDLIPKCAGIEYIAGLGILNHRHSVVKGFLRDQVDGELTARCQGFTNTLRLQHREIVNLPSLRVKYGEELRGLLVAREGKKLLGSDLSSLEDRIKHHFQWKLDPEYVKSQMASDFDPHLAIAVIAGLMTDGEMKFYKWVKAGCRTDANTSEFKHLATLNEDKRKHKFHELDQIRGISKNTNYACQYGAGIKTVARTAKVSEAVAKRLHTGYHKLNWSIAKISNMTTVKKTSFGDWQLNPINKFWYSLRSDKDRFSTLVQGTGAYILDLWLYHLDKLSEKRKLENVLLGQFHDELIVECDDDKQDDYSNLVNDALGNVNDQLKLNRELACEVKFGDKYSDIH
jgi:hypothetical protein